MEHFDVVIVGASFSGLTLAHHLPRNLKVLLVDAKPIAGSSVESTGLITTHTREEFASFFDIDRHITNAMTTLCVVAPDYEHSFFSSTDNPWIFQTDTKNLIKDLAEKLPLHVTFWLSTAYVQSDEKELFDQSDFSREKPLDALPTSGIRFVRLLHQGKEKIISTRFLVGADGGHSKVARSIPGLSLNSKFLFGYEQVFGGDVLLGVCPESTIYHFWFGEFSLGYGGWLSPTVIGGKKAFRIGLAKLLEDQESVVGLLKSFLETLEKRGIVRLHGAMRHPIYQFGSPIPIGGVLRTISKKNVLLIGDAAGFCGAFAADGIKGSVISGKEAAPLIAEYLSGNSSALGKIKPAIDRHHSLMGYYRRQVRYRWIWDRMVRNRTFSAMYRVIESEKELFLDQFCGSKERGKSLVWMVLKIRNLPKLMAYAWYVFLDIMSDRSKGERKQRA